MARRKFKPMLVTSAKADQPRVLPEIPEPPFSGKLPETCSADWAARLAYCRTQAKSLTPLIREANLQELQGIREEFDKALWRTFLSAGKRAMNRDELEIRRYNRSLAKFIDTEFRVRYKFLREFMDKELLDLSQRLKELNHSEGGLEESARRLLEYAGLSHLLAPTPQASADFNVAALPESAPAIFRDRSDKSENAPTFIQRVYGQWLTGEFTRADLRRLDPSAVQGLKNWERLHGKSDLKLPTIIERNDRRSADIQPSPQAREYMRLESAARYRRKNPKPA